MSTINKIAFAWCYETILKIRLFFHGLAPFCHEFRNKQYVSMSCDKKKKNANLSFGPRNKRVRACWRSKIG